jgi:hypothetical protein
MAQAQLITRATHGDSLADILERVLNTGLVIAGDIRIKLCDVELLSIQLRLLICSVEKARELGISWWWQTSEQPMAIPGKTAQESRKPLPAQPPLPAQTAELSAPPEEYRQFRDFQRFSAAMRGLEQGPR